jgi:hypothetical protein
MIEIHRRLSAALDDKKMGNALCLAAFGPALRS